MKSQFNIALIGEVDAGKSTTLGQILIKTGSVLESRIKEANRASTAQKKDFEPAFLLDAFEYERQNEMTVDITSVSCNLSGLDIRFLDTPGHRELSNKFIGGASFADFALLILDSQQEFREEHFRHARMLRILGLKDFGVIANKWDHNNEIHFEKYVSQAQFFLKKLDANIHFILPVQAKSGIGFNLLLETLKKTLLSLHDSNDLLVFFKKNKLDQSYWGLVEFGKISLNQKFYDNQGLLDLKLHKWCGNRIGEFTLSNRDEIYFAVAEKEHIQMKKKFDSSLVPLDDDWQNFDRIRTKWGLVSAKLIGKSEIELSQGFPFFTANNRANFFTLEKDHRILAVGIPHL